MKNEIFLIAAFCLALCGCKKEPPDIPPPADEFETIVRVVCPGSFEFDDDRGGVELDDGYLELWRSGKDVDGSAFYQLSDSGEVAFEVRLRKTRKSVHPFLAIRVDGGDIFIVSPADTFSIFTSAMIPLAAKKVELAFVPDMNDIDADVSVLVESFKVTTRKPVE